MRLLVLLLLVGTVRLVVCREKYFEFSLEVLLPDLQAIEQYVTKNSGTFEALVRWPKGISFQIRKDGKFLEISGRFFVSEDSIFAYTGDYDKLYFKDGSFYMVYLDHYSENRKRIASDETVYFRKDSENDPKPSTFKSRRTADRYLYISYFSLSEIEKMIEPFYRDNEANLQSFSFDESPRTFLATSLKPYPYFVEYTFENLYAETSKYIFSEMSRKKKRGKLRLLVEEKGAFVSESYLPGWLGGFHQGTDESNRVTIASEEVSGLEYDQLTGSLTPFGMDHSTLQVLGVRMARTGFLADVDSSGVKMLSSRDLKGSRIPNTHSISADALLEKLKMVEPKFSYNRRNISPKCRPNNVDFQVFGHVLEKRMNLLEDGNLDEGCPLVIEYKAKEPNFSYAEGTAKKICTNDCVLWVEVAKGDPVHFIYGDITLKYS